MKHNAIWKWAAIDAAATVLYIVLVVQFPVYFEKHSLGQQHGVLVPIFMLMVLVFSASVTGSLVFGRPIVWYLDGKKKEAAQLLGTTLALFFVFMVVAFACVVLGR